jgi:hypothetical protein
MAADLSVLETLLQKPKSEKQILAFFQGMSESERQSFSKHCSAWWKKQLKAQRDDMWSETSSGGITFNSAKLLPVAVLAAYCCCPFEVIKTGGWLTRIDIDLIYQALSDRRPKWASQWLAHCARSARPGDWARLRQLIREGVCDKPVEDHYIRLMIDGMSLKVKSVAARLVQDPDLLENDFWRIFQVPGVMRNESMFGYLDDAWLAGIVQLEKKGRLDRAKLFEAILSTPHMGFNQSQIKFFLSLHDRLKPTAKELTQRLPDYAGLVASPLAPVSKWSFELLRAIDTKAKLPIDSVADVLQASLSSSTKARVKESLRWLQDLLKRDASNRVAVCQIAVSGLQHEKADVQAEVWKFLQKHATTDVELIARIQETHPHVAASTRKTIATWLKSVATDPAQTTESKSKTIGKTSARNEDNPLQQLATDAKKQPKAWRQLCAIDGLLEASSRPPFQIPSARFLGTEFRRLDTAEPLPPIESLDELFEVASAVLESTDRFEDGERVIDALTRITPDLDHAGFGPLKKRLKQLARRFEGLYFIGARNQVDLVPLLQLWGSKQDIADLKREVRKQHGRGAYGLVGFLSLRNRAIFERIAAGQAVQLVGTMTHRGGWIEPQRLVERLKDVRDESELIESDLVLSLLRLAPDGRSTALKTLNRAKKLNSEFAQALRYALGGTVPIGDSAPLWVSAARSRAPYDDDVAVEKRFPGLGPDAGRVAKYRVRRNGRDIDVYAEDSPTIEGCTWDYPKNPRFDLPTLIPHQFLSNKSAIESLDTKPEPRECTNAAATVWPLNRDSFYAHRYTPADDLDPLFDPCTPMNPPQSFALVQSLVSGYVVYAPEVTAAIDLAITTIQDGRYDAERVGEYLAIHLESVQRLAKSLQAISEASRLHAFQVAQSILAIFDYPLPKKLPARMSDLYSLLYELLQELDLALPEHKIEAFAPSARGSSKTAKLVKQILEFSPEIPFDFHSVLASALEGRLEAGRILVD